MQRQSPTSAAPAALKSAVDRAASLLSSDPAAAERAIAPVVKAAPQDPRGLLILASAQRRQGRARAARTLLEPLARAYPRAANTQYEYGAVLADLGEAGPAAEALRRALAANPDLAEAWRLLGDLQFSLGDVAEAERAYAQHRRASIRDPRLRPIAETLLGGGVEAAEEALRAFLARELNHVEALRLFGELCARQNRHGDAEALLEHALALDPEDDGVRFSYAAALFRQQKASRALPQIQALLAKKPSDPAYRNLLAACLSLLGENDQVLEIYRELSRRHPKHPGIWLNFGHALRTVGRREEAVAAYKACLALAPGNGEAYWSLANLKVISFSPEEEAAMAAAAMAGDLSEDDRLHLHYALGKASEDRKDYEASFRSYAEGARIRRAQAAYDPDEPSAYKERCKALFTERFFAGRAGAGCASSAPIFIVGLPRAGSTLIEQILASHSEVEGTMELPELNLLSRRLGGAQGDKVNLDYPAALARLPTAAFAALGEEYLADTRIYRKLDRPRFIDKMPNNFRHVGLIHLILPNARIIDARRSPMASCFSAFKQHFNQGQTFSYDLTDLGRYYRDYVELMDHFDHVLPGRVHRVIYEDMVEDTEAQIRRLLAYCGLGFEESCLRFYDNDRAVRTVSSEQVRRPIFREGLEQWRNYAGYLGPLEAALSETARNWRGACASQAPD
jgi:predicted Zn-dependent protease